jgi:biotin carboxyl carrier protein
LSPTRDGDHVVIDENSYLPIGRLLAPRNGVFTTLVDPGSDGDRPSLSIGHVVGLLECMGEKFEVVSPFAGTLMGLLVESGERVRAEQPLAWFSL